MQTDSLKNVSPTIGNAVLYAAFSVIPLDIEGSNLENTGWMPSKKDISYMGEESYKLAIEECNLKNAKVLFKNVSLQWDSCDCGDGYGCSHGSYVYEINIFSNGKNITIEYTDGDSLEFYNEGKYCKIPTTGATIFDFIRMCEICEIELELSDYAVSLLK
jgi:hypothetical protein